MCTFMSQLPKRSKSIGQKKRSLVMTLKPCADDKTYYRVRLLAFNPSAESGSDRDFPHIQRFVHQHWGVNKEKGYPVLEDEITCPVTPHVHVEGNRYDACKVCTLANKYFIAFKESGWKDKEANKKNKEFGRKYQYIVPVYVVSNPNWEGDNNHFRVLIFNDKKFSQEFQKKIEKASTVNCVFNGKNAVDCCIHVKEEVEVVNQGQPNEYTFKKRVIDRVVFSNKPYDISAITKEAVDNMGFDDEYYTTSTPEEIDAFYKKYCTISNDDIPDNDIPVMDEEPKPVQSNIQHVDTSNTEVKPANDINMAEFDDLTTDSDDLPADNTDDTDNISDNKSANNKSADDIDAEALLADLDI